MTVCRIGATTLPTPRFYVPCGRDGWEIRDARFINAGSKDEVNTGVAS